jgi:hypothetical protein
VSSGGPLKKKKRLRYLFAAKVDQKLATVWREGDIGGRQRAELPLVVFLLLGQMTYIDQTIFRTLICCI